MTAAMRCPALGAGEGVAVKKLISSLFSLVLLGSYSVSSYLLSSYGFAKTANDPRMVSKMVNTKESVVDIQGKKFRKIEWQKEAFYIESLDSNKANAEMRVLCQQGTNGIAPAQVGAGVKTGQRSALVIEGIRQVCKEAEAGRREVTLDPAILAGLQVTLGKEENKKIIVSPMGVSFRADW